MCEHDDNVTVYVYLNTREYKKGNDVLSTMVDVHRTLMGAVAAVQDFITRNDLKVTSEYRFDDEGAFFFTEPKEVEGKLVTKIVFHIEKKVVAL